MRISSKLNERISWLMVLFMMFKIQSFSHCICAPFLRRLISNTGQKFELCYSGVQTMHGCVENFICCLRFAENLCPVSSLLLSRFSSIFIRSFFFHEMCPIEATSVRDFVVKCRTKSWLVSLYMITLIIAFPYVSLIYFCSCYVIPSEMNPSR